MTTTTRTPRRFKLVSVALGLLALGVVYLAGAAFVGLADNSALAHSINDWMRASFSLTAGALCILRAMLVRGQRAAWSILGGGLLAYGAGVVYYLGFVVDRVPQPANSAADLGFLAYYPAAFVAIVLLMRGQVRDFHASMWLDALAAGLGVTALASAVTIAVGPGVAARSMAASTMNIAYPIADLVLLVTVLSMFGLAGWRPGAGWWLLGISIAGLTAGDTLLLLRTAGSDFVPGGVLDVCYPAALALPAFAAWQTPSRQRHPSTPGLAVLSLPGILSLASLCLLFAGAIVRLPLVTVVLAAATVLVALVRTVLTFGEVQQLATSRLLARTDDLTGLYNRRHFNERLGEAGGGAAGRRHAVVLLDLDRFKEINNSIGHTAGDDLLRQVGRRIAGALRPNDTLARIGGDEFAVLLTDTDAEDAQRVARRVVTELARPFAVEGMRVHVAASIGVAAHPDHTSRPDELLRRADVAMYVAKGRRSGVELYEPDTDMNSVDRLGMIEALREAGETGQLLVHYQPKVDLRTGRCDSVEALARWRHPTLGVVAPDVFVPLAEQTGLMRPLTLEVLRIALEQCRRWRDEGLTITVAVNVSASNLLDANFPGQVIALLEAQRLPPAALELEITETTLMLDWVRSAAVLGALREIGVAIAIDDYGTGYCSLAYLRKLPVDVLKMDMSFVLDMERDRKAAEIVRHTISLAHSLSLGIVIEGVESDSVMRTLRGYGADLAQGFHLGRPGPGEEITDTLRRLRPTRSVDAPAGQSSPEARAGDGGTPASGKSVAGTPAGKPGTRPT